MNEENFKLAEGLVSPTYVKQSRDARKQREAMIKTLLANRQLPEKGWDDETIELFLHELAAMDSNNFVQNVGVGEREARVFSNIVAQRHFRMAHGIGRSGEIAVVQPKAAGSSLIAKLTNCLALQSLKLAGVTNVESCLVLPMATGMALTLALLALRSQKPQAQYVLWPRMDQKTCLKCILTAGLTPIVIENALEGDEVRTDLEALKKSIEEKGAASILCVLTTTSCFAPRAPDRVVEVAQICSEKDIGHIINNAYGVQVSKCMHLVKEASRVGRVTAFVQSTDKNFLVPVGGAIVASTDGKFIDLMSKSYPGRASASPILDLFVTYLSLGSSGYSHLLSQRKEMFDYFTKQLSDVAQRHGERLLKTPHNSISFAMTLSGFTAAKGGPTLLGSMLFLRNCSGARIVPVDSKKDIGPLTFQGYGSHVNNYPTPYMSVACPIGLGKKEIDTFLQRLDKTLTKFKKKSAPTVEKVSETSL